MSDEFKTIKYLYINSNKPDLIVIFPQALQTAEESQPLTELLSQLANVLYIESGYYGITKIFSLDSSQKYSLPEFNINFRSLLNNFSYKKLYIVAGSVGGIHALSFLEANVEEVTSVVMVSPALYKSRGVLDYVYKLFLLLGTRFYPEKCFGIIARFLKNNPKTPWIEATYQRVVETIGSMSYFMCLDEIIDFSTKNIKKMENLLPIKVYTLLGKYDDVFSLLCDEDLCKKSKSFTWIESGHLQALVNARQSIYEILKNQ